LLGLGLKRSAVKSIVITLNKSRINWWKKDGWLILQGDNWVITDNPHSAKNVKLLENSLLVKL
jgi:hypothetical protein